MKRQPTEEVVNLLVRDLAPTRRIPRLRAQLAALLGGGALVSVLVVAYRGLRPDALALLLSASAFSLVAAGLLAAALGASSAALALARPDRGRLARGGLLCGAGGLALAVGIVALCFAPSAVERAQTLHGVLGCGMSGILFAVPLSILAAFLVSAGAPWRLGMTAAVAALGTTAFGALAVHLTCPSLSVWHWVTAHALAPVLGTVLLALPLRALTLRWERGR